MEILNDSDSTLWGLPDPAAQSAFYDAVPTKRLLAFVVDLIVTVVIAALIVPLTAFIGIFFFPVLVAVVGFAYRVVTLANASATLGMRLMGIEFRTARGERFDLGMAVLHTGLFTVWCSIGLAQVVSVVLMLTTARKQGLSDLILGTAAINRPSIY
ncbi:RDD family protein [Celeribacter indicus]|uniref:RDD domain-containing protein n=1 Tax=Celeribacter indicus TaxID=1208324 RepID=A0A0B5DXF6_9RHOB|nr:RDD family protein [Celeribacter indicus]AJE47659.1 RDD domain-containing protein [Celeribacter indicus]SDW13461.1 RDD family protein [Celeribacter indicus]